MSNFIESEQTHAVGDLTDEASHSNAPTDSSPELTLVERVQAEEAKLRAGERAARDRLLGKVERPAGELTIVRDARTNDKFFGALGLFVLRLVTAAIMGVHGYQHLTDFHGTETFLTKVGIPDPHIMAWVLGIGECLAALGLLFGALTRLAGLGVAAIAISALTFVRWGKVNPFVHGQPGFTGELELLLAGVGVLFLLLGAGGWSIDGGIRRSRNSDHVA
jgi:putative oxidoreductase